LVKQDLGQKPKKSFQRQGLINIQGQGLKIGP